MTEYKAPLNERIKFNRAEIYYFAPIELSRAFWDSTGGPFTKVPVDAWVVLYDEEGVSGQGPCSDKMRTQFLPQILNGEVHTCQEWQHKLHWSVRNCGFSGESALELGRLDYVIHDILAKRKRQPLHRYLGAERDWALVYASGCGTGLTDQEMVQEAEEYVKKGYTTIKMKAGADFGRNIANDVRRVELVRKAIGSQCRLAVDVNQLWKADQALEFIERIEHCGIDWLEEPVHSYDMKELKKLTAVSPIPIAMGESPRCYYPLESYVEAGVQHLEPIPSNLSSVEEWMRARDLAHRHGLRLSSGGYSHMTASFVAAGREEDMVEYLTPVMEPLYEIMELRPKEKGERFLLPDVPGSCMRPDFQGLIKAGCIEHVEYIRKEGK